jgi:predicted HTH transcriptional regulator
VSKYILDLISMGEHQQQDFKFEINDARKIARTLVAFSNTDGGKILIGVKDNGKIAGVRSEEEYYMIETAVSVYCKPEIKFQLKKWDIQGKTVLEVDIPKGIHRPYLSKNEDNRWLSYVRVKDQNFLANSIQIRVWKNEKRTKGVFLEFTEKEKILLDYLQTKPISLSQYTRISGLNRKKASDILVRFISLGVVEMNYSEKEISYSSINH